MCKNLVSGGLLLTAADGTILRANRTFCRLIGHEASELGGRRRIQDLLTMGGRMFHQTHWGRLLQIQGTVPELKLQAVHRKGRMLLPLNKPLETQAVAA
jgi:sigma-B regulation protein RsbU (phosphoserine phosphatase)